MDTQSSLPDSANVVIVGAGIVGCSTAYHLTQLGRDDVVVVDQGPLPTTGGSSNHAPGIMFQTADDKVLTKFAMYSRELYSELDDEEAVVFKDRPVLDGDETLGYVHSAEYGYTVGSCIAYAYLPPEYAEPGTEVEIRHEGERYAATVREEPLYDPERERVLS